MVGKKETSEEGGDLAKKRVKTDRCRSVMHFNIKRRRTPPVTRKFYPFSK